MVYENICLVIKVCLRQGEVKVYIQRISLFIQYSFFYVAYENIIKEFSLYVSSALINANNRIRIPVNGLRDCNIIKIIV